MNISVADLLKAFPVKGLPFPKQQEGTVININAFKPTPNELAQADEGVDKMARADMGNRLWRKNIFGQWVFLPAKLNGVELPNCLINISGEKEIVETNLVDVGTVFEKVYTKPYEISILCTLVNGEGTWPEAELKQMYELWKIDDSLTLSCALTDIYLKEQRNFVLTSKNILTGEGDEEVEIIQFNGRSNIEFELKIIE